MSSAIEMTDLRSRIDAAIARVTASRAADEVLAEIARTHTLVPNEVYELLVSFYREEHEG